MEVSVSLLIVFMSLQPMLHRRHYVLAVSVPSSVRPVFLAVPNRSLSLRNYTECIAIKFAECNHHQEQLK